MPSKLVFMVAAGGSLFFLAKPEPSHRWSQTTAAHAFVATFPIQGDLGPEIQSFNPLKERCIASIEKNLPPGQYPFGVNDEEARSLVASSLTKAGIGIATEQCNEPPSRSNRLRLDVAFVKKDRQVAYHVTLRLMETMARQIAKRTDNEVTLIDAPIWQREELAIVNENDAATELRVAIGRVADEFARAFLEINPH